MSRLPHYQLFIDGEWTEGSSGQVMESANPATGETWATFACASEADVNRAVQAAARALDDPEWRDMTQTARGKLLYRLAELIGEHAQEIGRIETTDSGKLLAETASQTAYVADYYRYYAGLADKIEGAVTFDDVTFGYDPHKPVLKHVSLSASPGETVALVGPTGAGKTTIVNLLSRFYDVDAGAIAIDGHDVRDVQQASIRKQLGIVLQDTFLFSGTVMDNIRYGRLEATDEEVYAAARLANADWFIRRLPHGYQTQVSEQGHNFSQGQRQLLAIARAILADPRILILDEATSSVDTRTEMLIQQALLNLMAGRTAFVIAHRLSTIRSAEQVLVIDDGRIVERGTHEGLLARQGFYHRMYMSQYRRAANAGVGERAESPGS